MKKNITRLLPYADEAVNSIIKTKQDNGRTVKYIPKEYKGYISSFGAAVIQSGLLPALYFNYGSERSVQDRKLLMNTIFEVMKKAYQIESDKNLLDYAKESNNLNKLKEQILDAATALKLVIRTYKLL